MRQRFRCTEFKALDVPSPFFFAAGCHCSHFHRGGERPETFIWQDVSVGATTPLTRGGPRVLPPASGAGLRGPCSHPLQWR